MTKHNAINGVIRTFEINQLGQWMTDSDLAQTFLRAPRSNAPAVITEKKVNTTSAVVNNVPAGSPPVKL